mmetsp:Transcript_134478/g.190132  ORF Transcript_134478/g.190132 Transcript_134478/m.190132 type:complete len:221 (-) Transcript_134478:9-671(-)
MAEAKKLKLYGHPLSQPTASVIFLCNAIGVEYDFQLINLMKGEQKEEFFLKINPNHYVPAIDDNGFTLYEGAAILQYICESKSNFEYYPQDAKVRAKVNQYLHFHHGTVRQFAAIVRAQLFKSITPEEAQKVVEGAAEKLEKFIGDNKFLAGDKVTIADFLAAGEFQDTVAIFGFNLDKYEKVKAWWARVLAIEAVSKQVAAAGELFKQFVAAQAAQKKE